MTKPEQKHTPTRGIDPVPALQETIDYLREELWAERINYEEAECAASDTFQQMRALVSGSEQEQAVALNKMRAHVEHAESCRKGSCDSDLHASKRVIKQRNDLVAALRRIETWDLPATEEGQGDYETEHGSNGAKAFIRAIARHALAKVTG